MDSVTVRVRVAEFFATMIEISEWLDDNHYQHKVQIRPYEDAVVVTVDFPAAVAADAFAMRFGSVYRSSPRDPTS